MAAHFVRPAEFPDETDLVRALFRDYAAELDIDFCFQGFERELAELPGYYAPPRGSLLLATDADRPADQPLGCIALRPMPVIEFCEMKRLFVRPAARGSGLGRALAEEIVQAGRRIGYRAMRLDTLERLTPAIELYRALGFREIAPYYSNPIPGVRYFELTL